MDRFTWLRQTRAKLAAIVAILALPAFSIAAWTVDSPPANSMFAKNLDIDCDGQADSQLTKVIRIGWQDSPAH